MLSKYKHAIFAPEKTKNVYMETKKFKNVEAYLLEEKETRESIKDTIMTATFTLLDYVEGLDADKTVIAEITYPLYQLKRILNEVE